MKVLILSCGTGGGHHAAAKAIEEELTRREVEVSLVDPFRLVSARVSRVVSNLYIRIVQKAPFLFGVIYMLGALVDKLPGFSPVYYANKWGAKHLKTYLSAEQPDVVVTTHLYPAEMLTYLKRSIDTLPPTMFVSTDYTCIPFVGETDCDVYVIPQKELAKTCVRHGIAKERILPLGIPVSGAFVHKLPKDEARSRLELPKEGRMILLAGGSMGAGQLAQLTAGLRHYLQEDDRLIVICGTNEKLFRKMERQWGTDSKIRLLKRTEEMPVYFAACDLLYTKPGGLTSTEAAAAGIPFVHMNPIPGCESANRRFFVKRGLSASHPGISGQIHAGMRLLQDSSYRERMQKRQKSLLPQEAAKAICDQIMQM